MDSTEELREDIARNSGHLTALQNIVFCLIEAHPEPGGLERLLKHQLNVVSDLMVCRSVTDAAIEKFGEVADAALKTARHL